MIRNGTPKPVKIAGQHVGGKARLLLIEIDRDDLEANRRAALQGEQHVKQRVGILAARQAHHDAIAVGDHAKVADRLAHRRAQLRLQFLEVVRRPLHRLIVARRFRALPSISLPDSAG
jgi:hypothetical protein